MMAEQPPLNTSNDILFLLTGMWDSQGADANIGPWLCSDCCMIEGMLMLNPAWQNEITIVRVDYPQPRPELVALLGDGNHNAPTLILSETSKAHQDTDTINGLRILTDPEIICRQLAASYGGARPK
jgi:hypothetical protein